MTDLLIRNLDPATHEELKRRAQSAGMSVQAYASRLLDAHTGRPSLAEWSQRLEELPRHPETSGAEALRRAREQLL